MVHIISQVRSKHAMTVLNSPEGLKAVKRRLFGSPLPLVPGVVLGWSLQSICKPYIVPSSQAALVWLPVAALSTVFALAHWLCGGDT